MLGIDNVYLGAVNQEVLRANAFADGLMGALSLLRPSPDPLKTLDFQLVVSGRGRPRALAADS